MNLGRLICREIVYRKLNFLLGVLSVLVAVGCLVGLLLLLDQHDRQTDAILQEEKDKTAVRMAKLEDDYRKIGVDMGFNLLILPKDQNLADLYADDYAVKDMPEEYAQRLATAKPKILTINHVLPTLQQKVKWPEQERTIILVGVRGQVLIQNPRQKPIMEAVPAGAIVLGHELHRGLKLKKDEPVTLLGRSFKVHKVQPEKGNKDDITVWINLTEAQEMLGKTGRINAILALECGCEADRLPKIRADVARILPDTQVVEFATQAVARAEARNRAIAEGQAAVQQMIDQRARVRAELEGFAALLVPLVLLAAAVWVGFLMLANVRERKGEIGILRAIGLGSRQILGLFLGKAAAIGLLGALLGYLAGVLVASWAAGAWETLTARQLTLLLLAAPLVAGLASWIPALLAARQDPALVLRES